MCHEMKKVESCWTRSLQTLLQGYPTASFPFSLLTNPQISSKKKLPPILWNKCDLSMQVMTAIPPFHPFIFLAALLPRDGHILCFELMGKFQKWFDFLTKRKLHFYLPSFLPVCNMVRRCLLGAGATILPP